MEKIVRVIIVEDEEPALKSLLILLDRIKSPAVKVLASCSSVEAAKTAVWEYDFDLLFLDIDLGPDTAFDLLENLQEEGFDFSQFQLVFTTSHNLPEYYQKAFQFAALHYLLKPISLEKLKDALSRYKAKPNNIEDLLSFLSPRQTKHHQPIFIPSNTGSKVQIFAKDIVFCKSCKLPYHNCIDIYLQGGRKLEKVKIRLGQIEDKLDETQFIRTHKSYLLNVAQIKEIDQNRIYLYEKGYADAIPISKHRLKNVKRILGLLS